MSRVEIYDTALKRLLASRQGPVGRIVEQKAEAIFQAAQTNIAATFEPRTGDLQASLKKVPIEDEDGFHMAVGADAQHRGFPYARALETGVNPLTGEDMVFKEDKAYMVPAVVAAGFRQRS